MQTYKGCVIASSGVLIWIDEEDFERISRYRWRDDGRGYAVRKSRGCPTVKMHREILGLSCGDGEVDHINRNRMDNRKSNLRLVTRSQNQWNRADPKRGLRFDPRGRKHWSVVIYRYGKRFRTPACRTPGEAIAMSVELRARLHGEFAGPILSASTSASR